MPATELEAQIEELTGLIKQSQETANQQAAEMAKKNEQVDKLLEEQEKLVETNRAHVEQIQKIEQRLETVADEMKNISENYTDTVGTLRKQLKQVPGSDGGSEQSFFRVKHSKAPNAYGGMGAVFSCKQEAVELGMYLMATMKRENPAKRYARNWIGERSADLQFIPNIPKSFIEEQGQRIIPKEDMERITQMYGKYLSQDLASNATPGSALTTPEFVNTLIRNVEMHGRFRANVLLWPMGAELVKIPRRKSGFGIQWEGEGESITGDDPDFELIGMQAKKGALLHKWSSELNEDAALSIADIFMFEYSLAVAREEDRIGFNGDGSGGNEPGFAGFYGVLGLPGSSTPATADAQHIPHIVTGAAGDNLITEVKQGKLREMLGVLPTWARDMAAFYMHRTVLAALSAIETTAGYPVVEWRNGNEPNIMGEPVIEVDQCPTATDIVASTKAFAYGNLRRSWILGDRRNVELQTSEHYAFNTDELTTRLTYRQAYKDQAANGTVQYETGTL